MEDIQKVIQKLEDGIKKEASQLQKGQKRQKKNSERIGLTKKQCNSHNHISRTDKRVHGLSAKKVKESTIKSDKHIYRKINGRIGHIHLSNLNKELLQDYIDELDQTYSKNYVERIYYAIQKALSYAKFKGYIQANYIKQVEISARKDEIKKT